MLRLLAVKSGKQIFFFFSLKFSWSFFVYFFLLLEVILMRWPVSNIMDDVTDLALVLALSPLSCQLSSQFITSHSYKRAIELSLSDLLYPHTNLSGSPVEEIKKIKNKKRTKKELAIRSEFSGERIWSPIFHATCHLNTR